MDDFTVAYEVDQQVKEGEQTQAVTENYTVTVHVDKDGAMAVSYTHLDVYKRQLHILCEITMGKYQEQLLSLEDKLESGLYCELTDKTLHDGDVYKRQVICVLSNVFRTDTA